MALIRSRMYGNAVCARCDTLAGCLDHARNADDQRDHKIGTDGRVNGQLGSDCGDLTRDAAEE